jgi:hypothetical protein
LIAIPTVNDCVSRHAVWSEPSLQAESPENGNIPECGWRLSGVFGVKVVKYGAWRPIANSQKPAIGGHFSGYQGWFLGPADWLAGDAALIAPVST